MKTFGVNNKPETFDLQEKTHSNPVEKPAAGASRDAGGRGPFDQIVSGPARATAGGIVKRLRPRRDPYRRVRREITARGQPELRAHQSLIPP